MFVLLVGRLSQILKSIIFEIFWSLQPTCWATLFEKSSKNVDFGLWGKHWKVPKIALFCRFKSTVGRMSRRGFPADYQFRLSLCWWHIMNSSFLVVELDPRSHYLILTILSSLQGNNSLGLLLNAILISFYVLTEIAFK